MPGIPQESQGESKPLLEMNFTSHTFKLHDVFSVSHNISTPYVKSKTQIYV